MQRYFILVSVLFAALAVQGPAALAQSLTEQIDSLTAHQKEVQEHIDKLEGDLAQLTSGQTVWVKIAGRGVEIQKDQLTQFLAQEVASGAISSDTAITIARHSGAMTKVLIAADRKRLASDQQDLERTKDRLAALRNERAGQEESGGVISINVHDAAQYTPVPDAQIVLSDSNGSIVYGRGQTNNMGILELPLSAQAKEQIAQSGLRATVSSPGFEDTSVAVPVALVFSQLPIYGISLTRKVTAYDPLSQVWYEQESGYQGTWTPTGGGGFNAIWNNGNPATLVVTISGSHITIDRTDPTSFRSVSNGNKCSYEGELSADRTRAGGTYHCSWMGTANWSAFIGGQ
jgi:hypothetical protein